jgi:hypothetical protein
MADQERFSFGEFEGQLISDVMKSHPSYVKWAMKTPNFNVELKKLYENTKIDYKSVYQMLKEKK